MNFTAVKTQHVAKPQNKMREKDGSLPPNCLCCESFQMPPPTVWVAAQLLRNMGGGV